MELTLAELKAEALSLRRASGGTARGRVDPAGGRLQRELSFRQVRPGLWGRLSGF